MVVIQSWFQWPGYGSANVVGDRGLLQCVRLLIKSILGHKINGSDTNVLAPHQQQKYIYIIIIIALSAILLQALMDLNEKSH